MTEKYQIQVQGTINERWSRWFDGMAIATVEQTSTTILTGRIADQAALRGIMAKLWDLNLSLISVHRITEEA
jgi:hypothetical protein